MLAAPVEGFDVNVIKDRFCHHQCLTYFIQHHRAAHLSLLGDSKRSCCQTCTTCSRLRPDHRKPALDVWREIDCTTSLCAKMFKSCATLLTCDLGAIRLSVRLVRLVTLNLVLRNINHNESASTGTNATRDTIHGSSRYAELCRKIQRCMPPPATEDVGPWQWLMCLGLLVKLQHLACAKQFVSTLSRLRLQANDELLVEEENRVRASIGLPELQTPTSDWRYLLTGALMLR